MAVSEEVLCTVSAYSSPEADVVVIGGGPAGSTCSTLLAQRGLRVRLFERERFPRFHIGESQLPNSDAVFRMLDVEPAVAAAGFVQKFGASFCSADGAIQQLEKSLSYDSKDANSLFNLGMIRLQAKNDPSGAVTAWQQLLKLNPTLAENKKAAVEKLIAQA